ncbi:hypothetical protein MKW92_042505 [Papaver armeniacum]|nr:hypothetical protein MKW92_042505 [Papaver armeniacum]
MMLFEAAEEEQWMLVEAIAKLAPPKALEYANPENDLTILHMAATHGTVKVVRALVNKNPYLTQIQCIRSASQFVHESHMVPLTFATVNATDSQKEVLEYLYPVTRDYINPTTGHNDLRPFQGRHGVSLIAGLIEVDLYGIVISICEQRPTMVKDTFSRVILEKMVERPFAFFSGANLMWWERCIYSLIKVDLDCAHAYGISVKKNTKGDEENPPETSKSSAPSEGFWKCYKRNTFSFNFRRCLMLVPRIKALYNKKIMHTEALALVKHVLTCLETKDNADLSILYTAIRNGTTEVVLEFLRTFPSLCSDITPNLNISEAIIQERNLRIFNFMCKQKEKANRDNRDRYTYIDYEGNSILHYAAIIAPARQLYSVSGAAFQMQRELQWFKGVESIVPREDRFLKNKKGDTAQILFTSNHTDLMKDGEKWMKDTSGSCMLVGALIATVAFAAAFTVPGGNVSDNGSSGNGLPVFLDKKAFMVFAIADALALFSSITRPLQLLLAVYTSRFSEGDFLKSLPQKMVIGLATLFVSMATILVSFGATFIIVLGKRFSWAPIAVALFGCVPVFLFGFLQFPLFIGMVYSTFRPIVFWKPKASYYRA